MATRKVKPALALVTDWAVGRSVNARLVALRLNGDAPVVLRAKDARAIAEALQSEADAVATVHVKAEEA